MLDEAAVAICINGICQSVMMASGSDLEAFGLGFGLSEGLIADSSDVLGVDVVCLEHGWQVDIKVLAMAEARLKERRRFMAGPSGCGLCGIDSLEAALRLPEPLDPRQVPMPDPTSLTQFVEQIERFQIQQASPRGHHAAVFLTEAGEYVAMGEDVGRHSALDKLIGKLSQRRDAAFIDGSGLVVMTSRCSHDLVVKAARVGLGCLVTLAMPSNLAVQSAKQLSVHLFCRHGGQIERYA